MNDKRDGGPAFPRVGEGVGNPSYDVAGMTLRDWFAGQALVSMHLSHDYAKGPCNAAAAERSYRIADAMLLEREGWK